MTSPTFPAATTPVLAHDPLGRRYESLIRLAEAIRLRRNREELFDFLAEELQAVVPFDAIAQYDGDLNKISWQVCAELGKVIPKPTHQASPAQTLAAFVFEQQSTFVVGDLDRERRFAPTVDRMREIGLHSVCGLPLTTVHRKLGVLLIASKQRDAYNEEEVRFLQLVAGQIALAMDDALNFEESQRAQERLQLLLDLTNRMVGNLDLRTVLREISANVRRVMNSDGAGITLPDPETGELRIYALDFPTGKGILKEGSSSSELSAPSVEECFRTGKLINLTQDQILAEHRVAKEGAQSICRLPLVHQDRVLGVLSVGTHRPDAFTPDDLTFLGRVANQIAIAVDNALAYGQIAELKDKLTQEKIYLEDEIRTELNFEEIIGTSEGLRRVLKQVETVAPTDSTVLIFGETGTGKELIARAVHNLSTRKANAFVKLNCAAIPMGLLESELFGHEKGAFTGAIAQRIGRFELAHRGTIFLDEIGEIPLELQPKLLRVLQEREFERLGSSRTVRADARLIAATNRDLEQMVAANQFRSDLFYRLNVFPVRIPPLRERPEDIPLLVRHFTQQFSRRNNRAIDTIPSETMEALVRYDWPGNIRELQNVLERAVIITHGPTLKVPLAELRARTRNNAATVTATPAAPLRKSLDGEERKQILQALEQANWVVSGPKGAAELLGMKRSTLQFRMQKLGIAPPRRNA